VTDLAGLDHTDLLLGLIDVEEYIKVKADIFEKFLDTCKKRASMVI